MCGQWRESSPMDEIDPKIYNWPHGGEGNMYADTEDIWRHITTYEFVNHSTDEYISLIYNSEDELVTSQGKRKSSQKYMAILRGFLLPAPHLSPAPPQLYVEIPIKRYAIDFGLSPTDPDRGFWLEGIEYNTWYKLETPHELYETIATKSLHFAGEYIKFYDALVYGIGGGGDHLQPLVKKKTKYHCSYNLQSLYEKSNHHFDLKFLQRHASEFYDLLEPHFSKNCEMMTNLVHCIDRFSKLSDPSPSSSPSRTTHSSSSAAAASSSSSSSSASTKRKFQEFDQKSGWGEEDFIEPKYSSNSSSHAWDPIDLTLDDDDEEEDGREEKKPSNESKPSQEPSSSSSDKVERRRKQHQIFEEEEDDDEEEFEFDDQLFLPPALSSENGMSRKHQTKSANQFLQDEEVEFDEGDLQSKLSTERIGRKPNTSLAADVKPGPKHDSLLTIAVQPNGQNLLSPARKTPEPPSLSSSGKVDGRRRHRIIDEDEEEEVEFDHDDFLPQASKVASQSPSPKRRGRPPKNKDPSLTADAKPVKRKRSIATAPKFSRSNSDRLDPALVAPKKDVILHNSSIESFKGSSDANYTPFSLSKSDGEKKAERLERLKGLVEEKKKAPPPQTFSSSSISSSFHPHQPSHSLSSTPSSWTSSSSSSLAAPQSNYEESNKHEVKRKSMKPDWQQKAERQQAERLALIQKKKDLPQDLRPMGIKLQSAVEEKKKGVQQGTRESGPTPTLISASRKRDLQLKPGFSESKPRMVILFLSYSLISLSLLLQVQTVTYNSAGVMTTTSSRNSTNPRVGTPAGGGGGENGSSFSLSSSSSPRHAQLPSSSSIVPEKSKQSQVTSKKRVRWKDSQPGGNLLSFIYLHNGHTKPSQVENGEGGSSEKEIADENHEKELGSRYGMNQSGNETNVKGLLGKKMNDDEEE
jgi:hypothetical protein